MLTFVGSLERAFQPRCFVTGATGYAGRHVVRELLRQGARVQGTTVAHVRPDSPRGEHWAETFEAWGARVDRSPWEADALGAGLREVAPTHVFACFGTTARRAREEGRAGDPYRSVDLTLLDVLLGAARCLDEAPRVVWLSSQGTGPRARGAYLRSRWDAERRVRESGLPFTVCRAPLFTGPDRDDARPAERLGAGALRAAAGTLRLLGGRRTAAHIAPMDADELAHGLVHAAFNYTTIGRVLEAEELRRETPLDRSGPLPATRRDDPRH